MGKNNFWFKMLVAAPANILVILYYFILKNVVLVLIYLPYFILIWYSLFIGNAAVTLLPKMDVSLTVFLRNWFGSIKKTKQNTKATTKNKSSSHWGKDFRSIEGVWSLNHSMR